MTIERRFVMIPEHPGLPEELVDTSHGLNPVSPYAFRRRANPPRRSCLGFRIHPINLQTRTPLKDYTERQKYRVRSEHTSGTYQPWFVIQQYNFTDSKI